MTSLPTIHFVNVVWGREMCNLYFERILPSQLTGGNLGAYKKRKAVYHLFTTKEDKEEILKSQWYKMLNDFIPVKFSEIVVGSKINKYFLMTQCHSFAVKEARKERGPLIFLCPDGMFSEGSMKYLLESLEKGKRLLLVASLRANREIFLDKWEKDCPDKSREMPSNKLVPLVLDSLHEFSKRQIWEEKSLSRWLSHLYWKIDQKNLLVRGFHLHPLLIWPEQDASVESTIDHDYYSFACPNRDHWEIIDDSDKVFMTDLTPSAFPLFESMPATISRVAFWVYNFASAHHREFAKHKIWIHSSGRNEKWEVAERASDRILGQVLNKATNSSFLYDFNWFFWWGAMKIRSLFSRCYWKIRSLVFQ